MSSGRVGVSGDSSSPPLFSLFNSVKIFIVKGISVFPLESQKHFGAREQVEIVDLAHAVASPDEGELLQGLVHILRYLGSHVDIRLADNVSEGVTESNLLKGDVKFLINSMFEFNSRIVEHFVFFVIRSFPFVSAVKLIHAVSLSAESFDHKAAELLVHDLKTTQEIQFTIVLLLLAELLGV